MSTGPFLAHGGAAGAALEVTFLLLPVALFAFFSWRSSRRARRSETGSEEASDGGAGAGVDDEKETP